MGTGIRGGSHVKRYEPHARAGDTRSRPLFGIGTHLIFIAVSPFHTPIPAYA